MKSLTKDFLNAQNTSVNLIQTVIAISEYKGKHELFSKQSPQILESLQQSAIIESVEASNRIEGVVAPPERMKEIVQKGGAPVNRSEKEIAGYRDVLALIHINHESIPITPNYILQLHRYMFGRLTPESGGYWKRSDNSIEEKLPDGTQQVRFRPVAAWQTPDAMERLCDQYRQLSDDKAIDSLLLIPAFLLDFLCIHPFEDGNGRMSRLMTLLLLYKSGHIVGRYIPLERLVEKQKEGYYETLQVASQGWHEANHSIERWRDYFLEVILLPAYREFEQRTGILTSAGRGSKTRRVIDAVQRLPIRFRKEDVQRACPGVSDSVLHRTMDELRKSGQLTAKRGANAYWEKTDAFGAVPLSPSDE